MSDTPTPATPPLTPAESSKSELWKRRIGVLWLHDSKSGSKYLSGVLKLKLITGKDESVDVIVMKSNNKTMEKYPDYEIFLNPPKARSFF